ncbi:MAG: 4Fe-4S binding protein, partial [Candidatus Thermoplasmatota archaeon]|nr:4Fe-4S binding protein [Candidatus Thermoplasmatota archaeon]
ASWAGLLGVSMTGLVYPYFFCVASPGACAGCPLGTLQTGFINPIQNLPLLLFLVGFMGFLVLIFGRGFCGWACPIGFLNEVLYKFGGPIRKMFAGPGNKLEPVAGACQKYGVTPKYYKYIILILIPVASLLTGKLIFTEIDPIGAVTGTIPRLFIGGFQAVEPYFTIKIILLLMWVLIGIGIMRSWCRFLCPLGAAMAPGNKVSLLSLKYNKNTCVGCKACVKRCPMDIDMLKNQRDLECILCGRCVEACKYGSLDMTMAGKELFK